MTFNVYRTTKGKVGEPVYAEIEVTNPRTGADYEQHLPDQGVLHQQAGDPAARSWPARDGDLKIEIRCISPTQYLGMAESDLYLLSSSGNFGFNYMKGLFGIWLQALVLTAIGVFAGTFLSWPVALLDDHRLLRRRASSPSPSWSTSPARPSWAAGRSSR